MKKEIENIASRIVHHIWDAVDDEGGLEVEEMMEFVKDEIFLIQNQTYEDCARIAENLHFSYRKTQKGDFIACMPGVCYCDQQKINTRDSIAQAIRAKIEKPEEP